MTWIAELTRSQFAVHTLDFVFRRPIFESSQFTQQKKIPIPTAHRILKLLREKGMLKVLREASGRRPALMAFRELLNIVEGHKAF